jgi:carbon monoxide dehydrogenase subunit G
MGIPIEKQFVINAASRDVWAFLTDPSKVAGCLPGAAITGQVDERTHTGTIAVKVGPVSARYKGTVRFERLDREEGVAEIAASGQDVRGKGGADMRMTSRVVARGPSETEVTVASTVNITGILAQFGRGLIQDISDQMFRQFTDAMRAALESAPARTGGARQDADLPDAPRAGAESADAQAPGGGATGGDTPGSEAIDAVSLGATVGGRALGRAVRRPGFWLAVVIVAAILWLIVD